MIMNKGKEVKVIDLLNMILEKGKRLHEILYEASKAEAEHRELPDEILSFDPDEWEAIALTLQHFHFHLRKFRKLKSNKERDEWFKENGNFLTLVRDLVCLWENRLPALNKA